MPRIRTIKPEFWNSPDTAAASAVARLLYLAMWNWADDAGRGECDLKALEGFAFPNDDIKELSGGTSDNFRDVLAEVVACYGVVVYMVDGRPYYEIPSWKAHQRNERVAKGRYPSSEEGVTCEVAELGGKRRKFRHTAAEAPTSSGPGTGEQGNRGTGEQNPPSPPTVTLTRVRGREPATPHDDTADEQSQARQIVTEFGRASGAPITNSTAASMRQYVAQCLHAGHDPDTIAAGIADWAASKMTHPNQIPGFVDRAAVRPRLAPTGTGGPSNSDIWKSL